MLLSAISLFLSADAATAADLSHFTKGAAFTRWGFDSATIIAEDNWYFGTDWSEALTLYNSDGTSPDGYAGVHPAGFVPFELARYSEPPIAVMVAGSRDKKIEILIESPMPNVNLCINDASYTGVGTNDVGSVQNCGTGKLYACFTGATAEADEDFGFYIDCKSGCEDMAIDVWIRVRTSERSWDQGKTTVASDLEHWCEKERGTKMDDGATMYYTYPSDLLPDKPSKYPFHIIQIFGKNAGTQSRPNIWAISLIALLGLACLFA